jgi:transcriptional regulator with XRE-family HTH domain
MKKIDGFDFWKNVEKANRYTYMELANLANLNYNTIRNQRSQNVLPNGKDIYVISKVLGVSMEYLLTGIETRKIYPSRIVTITEKLMKISTSDLSTVERMIMSLDDVGKKLQTIG